MLSEVPAEKTFMSRSQSSPFSVIPLAASLLLIFFGWIIGGSPAERRERPASQALNDRVNLHLKHSEIKERASQLKVIQENLENQDFASKSPALTEPPLLDDQEILSPEALAKKVYEDTRTPSEKPILDFSPEDRIRAELARKKWLYEYDKDYRDEFIKSFQQNALREGYKVEVGPDLVVRKVERVNRAPQSLSPQDIPRSSASQ